MRSKGKGEGEEEEGKGKSRGGMEWTCCRTVCGV